MAKDTPAGKVVGAIANAPTIFFVPKGNVAPMLTAITGQPAHRHLPPVKGLLDRDDSTGKFARTVGRNRRAIELAHKAVQAESDDLLEHHAERYPATHLLDGAAVPHPKAGQPTPVYATQENGAPVFRKDDAGKDTTERVVAAGQFNIADMVAYQKDMREMLSEYIAIECVGFTDEEFDAFRAIAPRLVDPLLDIEIGGPANATIAEQADALRAAARRYMDQADAMEGVRLASSLDAPVDDEAAA